MNAFACTRISSKKMHDICMKREEQEAQGLGALLDKMEDNDHINWITQRSGVSIHKVFENQKYTE